MNMQERLDRSVSKRTVRRWIFFIAMCAFGVAAIFDKAPGFAVGSAVAYFTVLITDKGFEA